MASTLYVDPDPSSPTAWDLVLDSSGSIAKASAPYALAQDAASEIKTFAQECYYDQTKGIPYFAEIIGKAPSIELLKSQFVNAAMNVPTVTSVKVFISAITDRKVIGQVQVTDATGTVSVASF
jgi:hypothetical protein